MGFIYKVFNDINTKVYIGADTGSVELMTRWNSHLRCYTMYKGRSKLYNAMKKYGVHHFKCEIIDHEDNLKLLQQKEEYWIEKYNACKSGYNILPTSRGGWTLADMSEEDAIIRQDACRRGMQKVNELKWKNEDPAIVELNRAKAKKSLNDFYKTVNRSEHVKEYWDSLSEDERNLRNVGIRNFVSQLTPEERVQRSAKATAAAAAKNSNHYQVITPKGQVLYVIGIGPFAKSHNLNAYTLLKVSLGRLNDYQGWKCYKIDKISGEVIIPEKFIQKKRGPKPKEFY